MDVPQFPGETFEIVKLVPHERVQWIDEQMVKVFSRKDEFLTKTQGANAAGQHFSED